MTFYAQGPAIVGHSNTVPEIIAGLGAGTVPPIGDAEYDRLFVVTLVDAKSGNVVRLRYYGCGE